MLRKSLTSRKDRCIYSKITLFRGSMSFLRTVPTCGLEPPTLPLLSTDLFGFACAGGNPEFLRILFASLNKTCGVKVPIFFYQLQHFSQCLFWPAYTSIVVKVNHLWIMCECTQFEGLEKDLLAYKQSTQFSDPLWPCDSFFIKVILLLFTGGV